MNLPVRADGGLKIITEDIIPLFRFFEKSSIVINS
jgi:hypothetical protein